MAVIAKVSLHTCCIVQCGASPGIDAVRSDPGLEQEIRGDIIRDGGAGPVVLGSRRQRRAVRRRGSCQLRVGTAEGR